MKAHLAHIESIIFERNVLEIIDVGSGLNKFHELELKLLDQYDPFYIQIALPSADSKTIHFLESYGFNFAEFRLQCTKKIDEVISSHSLFPYDIEDVVTKEDLYKIFAIAENIEPDDRFYSDPLLTPDLSIKRTKEFIKRSFNKRNERLLKLINRQTNELIGYRTFRLQQENEVLLYLTGISWKARDYNKSFEIINTLLLAYLKSKNINFANAIISGKNYFELEFYLKKMEFSIKGTSLLLRKIYHK